MMVNCPRCGFSQPQDQYCARCGVDMFAFKPAGKPLYQKILSSTVFQIAVLVVVVVGVFSVARKQRHRELAERVAEIENARNSQILSSTSSSRGKSDLASSAPHGHDGNTNTAANSTIGTASNQVAADSAPVALGSPAPPNAFVPAGEDGKASAPTTGARAAKAASALVVTFGEIHRNALGEIIAAAEPNSGMLQGPILSGVVPGLGARIKALQGAGQWESLDMSSHTIKAAQVSEFYGGQRDESNGQFLGFVVEANPSQLDEGESHIQLRVWRYLRESGSQPEEFSIPLPDSFTVPSGGAIFIAGSNLLPRRQLSDLDRRFYDPMKVLHLLSTEEYRQGLTELFIMIEPR